MGNTIDRQESSDLKSIPVADLARNKKPVLIGMLVGFIFLGLGITFQSLKDASILNVPSMAPNILINIGSCVFVGLLVHHLSHYYLVTPKAPSDKKPVEKTS